MAVLILGEVTDGALNVDATGKAVNAVKGLGDVTVLVAGAKPRPPLSLDRRRQPYRTGGEEIRSTATVFCGADRGTDRVAAAAIIPTSPPRPRRMQLILPRVAGLLGIDGAVMRMSRRSSTPTLTFEHAADLYRQRHRTVKSKDGKKVYHPHRQL